MRVLGLSAFHRDAAAVLVVDGVPIAAEKEERFTKKPRDPSFPHRAARACLAQGGLDARDVERVVFYEKPLLKFERLLVSQLAAFPRSSGAFADTMFVWLGDRLWLKNRVASELEIAPEKVFFCEHHRAHAAAAFLPSPFEEAAILCVDDFGEWATTSLGRGSGTRIELLVEQRFPHSLGLVASALTQFLGFEPGSDEHKLEALAALGRPRFRREFEELVRARDGGAFEVDARRFRFAFDGSRLCDDSLAEVFGPPRISGGELRIGGADARDADLAASLQDMLETRTLELARELHRRSPSTALCFTGQLAQNRALNARLLREGPFESLFIPPDPDDAGAALGAALSIEHADGRTTVRSLSEHARLGAAVDDAGHSGARALGADAEHELARRLADGQTVAWVRGRMDFTRESLGSRSILAAVRANGARARLLGAVRQSEAFLPCRLAVTRERANEFFELPTGAAHALRFGWLDAAPREALSRIVSDLGPRSRPQVVDREFDPALHALLTRLGETTGAPLAWHGSFELRGSPCVRSESDALEAFRRSALDALFVEDRLYERATVATPA